MARHYLLHPCSPLVLLCLLMLSSSALSWHAQGQSQDKGAGRHSNMPYKNRELELEELLSLGSDTCTQKPCVQSGQCCPSEVCVDVKLNGKRQVTGTCLPIYGANSGNNCAEDDDCEPGLRCMNAAVTGSGSSGGRSEEGAGTQWKSCQSPGPEMTKKQYNYECSHSSECDASRGLCCQLIKRHRMAPRRACLYFTTAAVCLGPVDVTFAQPMAISSFPYTPSEQDYFRARIG